MVSIIVVSYETKDMTVECLRSVVRETDQVTYEVLFIDNDSKDGSFEAIECEFGDDPRFLLKKSDVNLGFAAANNELAKHARGEYILLLNPDTVVLDHAVEKLIDFARANPGNRIWGGKTVFADGSINPTNCWGEWSLWALACQTFGISRCLPKSDLFNSRVYPKWDRSGVKEVGMVTGCWFLMDAQLWHDLEGFDPEFFMYGEEADLCMRAKRRGANPIVSGEPVIIHYTGASEKNHEGKWVKLLDAEIRLFRRHWGSFSFNIALLLIDLKVWLRAIALRLKGKSGEDNVWASIWKRRPEWRRSLAK